MPSEVQYLTVSELVNYLRIGRSKAYALVGESDFPAVRCGKKILIDKKRLDEEWLKSKKNRVSTRRSGRNIRK